MDRGRLGRESLYAHLYCNPFFRVFYRCFDKHELFALPESSSYHSEGRICFQVITDKTGNCYLHHHRYHHRLRHQFHYSHPSSSVSMQMRPLTYNFAIIFSDQAPVQLRNQTPDVASLLDRRLVSLQFLFSASICLSVCLPILVFWIGSFLLSSGLVFISFKLNK